MKTAVVILNWNTREYLERFLPSLLLSCEGLDAEVIVADSASTDGSMEMMKEKFPHIRTIELDRNYGFAGGYDLALKQIESEYYLLLNSDVKVTEGWLAPLLDYMSSHPEAAACQPKLLDLKRPEMFEYAGGCGGLRLRLGAHGG
mgnify:CR=1 FL=1